MISRLASQLSEILTDKPKSRGLLCEELNCDDRRLREAAEELKLTGFNIASSTHKSGYWLGTKEEMEEAARGYEKRGKKELRIAKAIRQGMDIGQMEVSV